MSTNTGKSDPTLIGVIHISVVILRNMYGFVLPSVPMLDYLYILAFYGTPSRGCFVAVNA
jgi:hypothetical protein